MRVIQKVHQILSTSIFGFQLFEIWNPIIGIQNRFCGFQKLLYNESNHFFEFYASIHPRKQNISDLAFRLRNLWSKQEQCNFLSIANLETMHTIHAGDGNQNKS